MLPSLHRHCTRRVLSASVLLATAYTSASAHPLVPSQGHAGAAATWELDLLGDESGASVGVVLGELSCDTGDLPICAAAGAIVKVGAGPDHRRLAVGIGTGAGIGYGGDHAGYLAWPMAGIALYGCYLSRQEAGASGVFDGYQDYLGIELEASLFVTATVGLFHRRDEGEPASGTSDWHTSLRLGFGF